MELPGELPKSGCVGEEILIMHSSFRVKMKFSKLKLKKETCMQREMLYIFTRPRQMQKCQPKSIFIPKMLKKLLRSLCRRAITWRKIKEGTMRDTSREMLYCNHIQIMSEKDRIRTTYFCLNKSGEDHPTVEKGVEREQHNTLDLLFTS
jgi:hypothetical protein